MVLFGFAACIVIFMQFNRSHAVSFKKDTNEDDSENEIVHDFAELKKLNKKLVTSLNNVQGRRDLTAEEEDVLRHLEGYEHTKDSPKELKSVIVEEGDRTVMEAKPQQNKMQLRIQKLH
jgi:hypothetical protein